MPYRIIGRGPLAQLVERHVYTVDVIGSSPVGPTLEQYGFEMSNDGTNWHSDDELASALERALEIPADTAGDAGAAYEQPHTPTQDSPAEFGDLFAVLVEGESAPAPVADVPSPGAAEQVFESLDEFKPRTNFIPVVGPESAADLAATAADSPVDSTSPVESEIRQAPANPVTMSSAQVTQPVRYDRKRLTFDEIVFGVTSAPENN